MATRYDRQRMLPEIGEQGQKRLSEARVLIVGAGGLGSPISTYLTGAGVGTIGIMDDDLVSITNLQRQILYSEAQEGSPKVECAKERLSALNSTIRINTYKFRATPETLSGLLPDYDIIVDATDNFNSRYELSDACAAAHKPLVHGAIHALEGCVAVLCVGHATFRTLYPDKEQTLSMPHPGRAVVGVTPAIVGSVQASQVIQLICGYGEPLIDRLWTIDLRNMQSYIIEL